MSGLEWVASVCGRISPHTTEHPVGHEEECVFCEDDGCVAVVRRQQVTPETLTDDMVRDLRSDGRISQQDHDEAIYGTAESPSTILSLIEDGHLSETQVAARRRVCDALNTRTP